MPGAGATFPYGIQNGNIVGSYTVAGTTHGFLYDGLTYTTIDVPLSTSTRICDIDGNTLVGYYTDSAQVCHGVVVTLPEPSGLVLLTIGAIGLLGYCYRMRSNASSRPPV